MAQTKLSGAIINGMPIDRVITHEKTMPTRKPATLPSRVSSKASVMNALKISRPGAPSAILTPTSRTRSLSEASWMLTLTMPPPMSASTPESMKMML